MNIDDPNSMEEATQIARSALPLANEYALPANPINISSQGIDRRVCGAS